MMKRFLKKVLIKILYPAYVVNGGKSTMVQLPCGFGVNRDISHIDADLICSNPVAGISYEMTKEIMKYIARRDA